jgi:predicted glycosyltransferase
MKAWIDIDNPPQVQYLSPFVAALEGRGIEVIVTARDYDVTLQLLRDRRIPHRAIGRDAGANRAAKVVGTLVRATHLAAMAARAGRPRLLLSTSRSASLAAGALRIPAFMILDYEHVELRSFRAAGVTVMHPKLIDAAVFRAAGFPPSKLIPFDGTKEDISFSGRDIDRVSPHDFGVPRGETVLVLVRPPSETSHYFNSASRDLNRCVLARLAANPAVRVVFSPRHPHQASALSEHSWSQDPILLDRPVEFVSLLKGVDWVICAGGTMLREAAYVGTPAISTFRSQVGAVDHWLEERGAIRTVTSPEELDAVNWKAPRNGRLLPRRPEVVDELVGWLLAVGE